MGRLRIVFMGTPDLAATCLSRLLAASAFEVVAAVSQPDRPKGRHLQRPPTPVKTTALAAGIPVFQPDKAREPEFLAQLKTLAPDLIAVAAYGQILPQALLDIPKHGCLNVHTSLLPRYRGAAPIQWAILNGDPETGVTIMKIIPELDAGDIVSQVRTPIHAEDDAQTLHDRLAQLGGDLLVRTLPDYCEGRIKPSPQPAAGVVHARKIRKEDGLVDWTRPAIAIWNQVRGLVPWPGAFTLLPANAVPAAGNSGRESAPSPSAHAVQSRLTSAATGEEFRTPAQGPLLKLWKAEPTEGQGLPGTILQADKHGIVVACGRGSLRLLELQTEGRRRMTAAEFLSGHPLRADQVLGAS